MVSSGHIFDVPLFCCAMLVVVREMGVSTNVEQSAGQNACYVLRRRFSSEILRVHWDGAVSGCNSGWLGSLWFSDPWAELNLGPLLTIENLMVSQPGTTAGLIRREYGLRLRAECATGRLGLRPPALNV